MNDTNSTRTPVPRAQPNEPLHWLQRPATIRILWCVGIAVLAMTLLAQKWIPLHGHFGWDDWFGFYAVFGFGGCVLMVVVAKALALWVKRPDTYYDSSSTQSRQGNPE